MLHPTYREPSQPLIIRNAPIQSFPYHLPTSSAMLGVLQSRETKVDKPTIVQSIMKILHQIVSPKSPSLFIVHLKEFIKVPRNNTMVASALSSAFLPYSIPHFYDLNQSPHKTQLVSTPVSNHHE